MTPSPCKLDPKERKPESSESKSNFWPFFKSCCKLILTQVGMFGTKMHFCGVSLTVIQMLKKFFFKCQKWFTNIHIRVRIIQKNIFSLSAKFHCIFFVFKNPLVHLCLSTWAKERTCNRKHYAWIVRHVGAETLLVM